MSWPLKAYYHRRTQDFISFPFKLKDLKKYAITRIAVFIITFLLALTYIEEGFCTQNTKQFNEKGPFHHAISNDTIRPLNDIDISEIERQWLEQKHVVRVRIAKNPPYHNRHPVVSGICVDYIQKAAEDFGFRIEFNTEDIQWRTALNDIINSNKHYDLFLTIRRTPEREKHISFTDDYIFVPWVIASKEDDMIRSMDDLNNQKVALIKGFAINEKIKERFPGVIHFEVDSDADALEAVATSKAKAYIGDLAVINYLIKHMGLHNLKISSGTPFGNHNQAMGIRKDWTALASILNKYVNAMSMADHLAILDKWVDTSGLKTSVLKDNLFLTKQERQWLKAHPVIRVGSDPFWAPIEFVDEDGQANGMAIDYLKTIERKLGIHFEITKGQPFYKLLEMAEKKSIDMLLSVAQTPERRKYLSFTSSYISSPIVIFSRPDMPYVGNLGGLYGKKIAVIQGASIHEILDSQHPQIKLVPVSDIHKALSMLGKDVVAYIGSPIIMSYYIMVYGDSMVKVVGNTPYSYRLALATRNDWPIFSGILQKALDSISAQEQSAIYQKWISVTYEHGFDYSLIWKIGGIAAVVVVLFIVWNRRLKFEVKKQTSTIKAGEAFLNDLLEAIPHPVFYKDKNGAYIGFNKAFEQFVGLKKENMVGKSVYDVHPPERANVYRTKDLDLLEGGGQQQYECQIQTADGEKRDTLIIKATFSDSSGAVSGIIGSILDITEIKRTQDSLRKSEERLQIIFNSTPVIMVLLNENRDVIQINQSGLNAIGKSVYEPEGFRLGHILDCSVWAQDPKGCDCGNMCNGCPICETIQKTFRSGQSFESVEATYKQKHANKLTERTVMVSTSLIRETPSKILLITIDDVTEVKNMEVQLLQAQKLEAIGNLAGGIAHDFNNILTPIIGMAEILMEDLPKDSEAKNFAENIFIAGKRGSDLVKQILTFSRQDKHRITPVKISSVIKEVMALCRKTIPSNVAFSEAIQLEDGFVLADPTQIHQIVMNLITNAYHALQEEVGEISVQLLKYCPTPGTLPDIDLKPGAYAELTVGDTGCGIDSATMEKMFEPYFTTKDQGKGTGLGLAVVYGIVKKYDGDIQVYSKPGHGTTFKVYLPLTEADTEWVITKEDEQIITEKKRILLVDDEESIVILESKMLERLGHQVVSRTSSVQALETFNSAPEAFDLVITDMAMPAMRGDQLARNILSVKPELPIILCTGFKEPMTEKMASDIGIKGLLTKPVLKTDMVKIINEVLSKKKRLLQA
ncbi:MAG: transporter substrate-binding domain-containing protein [Desulfatitalea sp.]|nr:transporter substrate-binding domain-containing protein [Desulfatitalea sp.]NNK02556.1 transporter substrate-binding domain-containing protein [Desulfatitalea sp.]